MGFLRFLAREILQLSTDVLVTVYEAARGVSERLPPIPETPVIGVKLFGEEEKRRMMHAFEKENDGFFFESVRTIHCGARVIGPWMCFYIFSSRRRFKENAHKKNSLDRSPTQLRKELRYVGIGVLVILIAQLLNGCMGTMRNQGNIVASRLYRRKKLAQARLRPPPPAPAAQHDWP